MSNELNDTWNEIKAGLGLFFKVIYFSVIGIGAFIGGLYCYSFFNS